MSDDVATCLMVMIPKGGLYWQPVAYMLSYTIINS